MSTRKYIQDELINLESSLPFNNNLPFSVPDGYFEGLAEAILARVNNVEFSPEAELAGLSPLLAGMAKIMPYTVPSSYFNETTDSISAIYEEEPVSLSYIGKQLPYSVPDNYFENLPEQILAKVAAPQAKVVPLFGRTWMRIASVAAVVTILFVGGYQLVVNRLHPSPTAKNGGSENTQLVQNPPVIEDIDQASTTELEEFVQAIEASGARIFDLDQSSSKKEVAELLKDVSTGEVESFLATMPVADDDLLTTN